MNNNHIKDYEYVIDLEKNKKIQISNCCEMHHYLDKLQNEYPNLFNSVLCYLEQNSLSAHQKDYLINDIEKIFT